MIARGDRVLVAVSGGPDSTALLAALAAVAERCGITLCAAHLNHQLRGEESLRDQRCAEALAQRLGVACVVGQTTSLPHGPNLEARARGQRYAFLARVAEAEGCTRIATGHTLDDQAETVLMRLLRGTGGDGMAGVRPVRDGRIIRPLIRCTRVQVLAFLHARGLSYCEDHSNRDRRFLRNRIRQDVMPLLESINPAVKRALASAAEIVTAEATVLDDCVRSLLGTAQADDRSLAVAALVQSPAGLRGRAVRTWLREQGGELGHLTATHVEAILDLAHGPQPNAQVGLPKGQLVVRQYDRLRVVQPGAMPPAVTCDRVLLPGATLCLESGWQIAADLVRVRGPHWQRPATLWTLLADAESLAHPVVVRAARPGDRVQPLGLDGHRKLHDIFIDRKLPRALRWTHPVLESDGEILWVPGVMRSRHAVITGATRSAWRVVARSSGIAAP